MSGNRSGERGRLVAGADRDTLHIAVAAGILAGGILTPDLGDAAAGDALGDDAGGDPAGAPGWFREALEVLGPPREASPAPDEEPVATAGDHPAFGRLVDAEGLFGDARPGRAGWTADDVAADDGAETGGHGWGSPDTAPETSAFLADASAGRVAEPPSPFHDGLGFATAASVPSLFTAASAVFAADQVFAPVADAGGPVALAAAAGPSPATSPANAIVAENLLPGNPQSEWGIVRPDSRLEGFAAEMSVDQGQSVEFKINSAATITDYRIDIYRLGYYGGDGARKVATIDPTTILQQQAPIRDAATGLVDCGNWQVNATWNVPTDATSGVYIAKLVDESGTGAQNHMYFVVRDDDGASDILFQTADTTWQAYNTWGGNSLYEGSPVGRAYKVSYNRPFETSIYENNLGDGLTRPVFESEYPMIRWLERNGYDVSYFTGIDTDRRGAELLEHDIFLSVGHDEYWSGQQRANVEAARDAGVNLAFFSGNEVFWKTRWETAIDGTGTPYRTLVCYKETAAGAKIDPSPEWTGTWRDPRFAATSDGGRPENALTGTIFTVNAYRLDTIKVSADEGLLRFWRDTSIAQLAPGTYATLTPNVLGFEWDEDVDNGYRPAGLVPLSSTTVDVGAKLQDYGTTYGPGSATHSLTLYKAASGALVFGAGTVRWSWGLDENHPLQPSQQDPRMQQATVNLFADMGVQPWTLQSNLIRATKSSDTVAPVSTIDASVATLSYNVGKTVTVTGTASDTGGGRVAAVEVSTDNGASWHRAVGRETWSYSFIPQKDGPTVIKTRAVDDSINLETAGPSVSVTVGKPLKPFSLWDNSKTPEITRAGDQQSVELGVKFESAVPGVITGIRFFKGSSDTGTHVGTLWASNGTKIASATFQNETQAGWQEVNFSTPIAISANTTYVASFHSSGGYAFTPNYFTTDYTRGPLSAPGGANGVYAYGPTTTFPTATFNKTNYWVDVVFDDGAGSNRNPVAVADSGFVVPFGKSLTIGAPKLLANDSDPDGQAISLLSVGNAVNGTVTLNAAGNPFFKAAAGYSGPASFTYTISDGRGGIASARVTLEVGSSSNANPVAVDDGGFRTPVGKVLKIPVSVLLANDSDPDGDSLSVTAVSAPQNGTVKLNAAGEALFTPLAGYSGPASFLYTVSDGKGGTAKATVSIDVRSNAAPVAVDDGGFTVVSGKSITLPGATLLANDSDPDGDSLTITGVSAPQNGTVKLNGGDPIFKAAAGYSGPASFMYTVNDGNGGTAKATVSIDVRSNAAPVAVDDSGFATPVGKALTIPGATLLVNDSDPDGDPLSLSGVGGAVNGTVGLNGGNPIFRPAAGYSGPASFVYTVKDGNGGSATATVSITVGNAAARVAADTADTFSLRPDDHDTSGFHGAMHGSGFVDLFT